MVPLFIYLKTRRYACRPRRPRRPRRPCRRRWPHRPRRTCALARSFHTVGFGIPSSSSLASHEPSTPSPCHGIHHRSPSAATTASLPTSPISPVRFPHRNHRNHHHHNHRLSHRHHHIRLSRRSLNCGALDAGELTRAARTSTLRSTAPSAATSVGTAGFGSTKAQWEKTMSDPPLPPWWNEQLSSAHSHLLFLLLIIIALLLPTLTRRWSP